MLSIGSAAESGSFGFVQQGQVDWVAFGKTTWAATSEVLQRFASANIQPVTFGAGIVLAEQFRLGPTGQSRLEEAISRVQGLQVLQGLLWVGFGYRSLLGTLAATVGGVKCIALCACLVDVHSDTSAASVLQELWRAYEFPDQYEPSYNQFLALVNICAGVMVKTPFVEIMDVMLGGMIWKCPEGSSVQIPEASNYKDIARALQGLFRLSRGEVHRITVMGGGECAFMAALAHWLFNFKIRVESDEQELIFLNSSGEEVIQVRVQYGLAKYTPIAIRDTTYLLRDFNEAIDRISNHEVDSLLIARTGWDGCLQRVFGVAFMRLLELPNYLGSYFGSLARIYAALAQGKQNIGTLSRRKFYDFNEGSHGQGFINTILWTFPELRNIPGLRRSMEVAAETTFMAAMGAVEFSVQALETLCQCHSCIISKGQDATRTSLTGSCLLGMVYAVRDIARVMAGVVPDARDERPLYPTIRGIKHFARHGKSESMLVQWTEGRNTKNAHLGVKDSFTYFALGLCQKMSESLVGFCPMLNVSILFQGPSVAQTRWSNFDFRYQFSTALSYNGVCCYIDGLRSLTCDPEVARLIHVLPGQIRYKDRSYQEVCDGKAFGGVGRIKEVAQVTPASIEPPEGSDTPRSPNCHSPRAVTIESWSENIFFCSYRISTPTVKLPAVTIQCVAKR